MIPLVDPGIRVFVEEYGEIRYMAETLKNRIEIAGISEVRESDLAFLGAVICHRGQLRTHWVLVTP